MSSSSSPSGSSDEDEGPGFRFPLRMRPTKAYKIAEGETLAQILTKPPGRRPQPEFQGEVYIPPGESKSNLKFKCQEPNCTAAFVKENALKSHQIRHRDRKLKCSFCNLTFKDIPEMSSHLHEFHPDLEEHPDADPLQCKKCLRTTRNKQALWRHVRESHRGPPKPCPICGVLFKRPDNLKEHMKNKHPQEGTSAKRFSCGVCNTDFTYKNSLRIHIKKVHRGESRPLRCVLCNTDYGCRVSYKIHMKQHIHPNFYPCEICRVKFPNRGKLKRHYECKSHREMEEKVGRKATSLDQVKPVGLYHQIRKQRKAIKREGGSGFTKEELKDICRKSIVKVNLHRVDQDQVNIKRAKSSSLSAAVYSTNPEVREYHHLSCTYCHVEQASLEAVKKHELICYGKMRSEKLNLCSKCDKTFDKPFKLVRHMRAHSDQRLIKCSYCDAKFKWERGREFHEKRIHFGIRNKPYKVPRVFSCNHEGCRKQYTSAETLRHHIGSVHLKLRYNCKTCGKTFKNAAILRNHVKKVHVENPTLLLCRPCKRAYKTRFSMLMHFKTNRHRLKVREVHQEFAKRKGMATRRSCSRRLDANPDTSTQFTD